MFNSNALTHQHYCTVGMKIYPKGLFKYYIITLGGGVKPKYYSLLQYSNTAHNVNTWQFSDPENLLNFSGDRAKLEV